MKENYAKALAFVWQSGLDDPADGYHVTPGDPGKGTKGGVIQATWNNAVSAGLVHGTLADASNDSLSRVLQAKFWQPICDELPDGVDLLYFNGLMMTGSFPRLFQQCLGLMGDDVDGWVGPVTLKTVRSREPETLIAAVSGVHYAYLTQLSTWSQFGNGWTARLQRARTAALALVSMGAVA